jgi:uncharacterized membrane protein
MIGRLNRQLALWAEHNLITQTQVDHIRAFEQGRDKARSKRGFAMVGVTAIFIGVLSLVASNWSQIPATMKIILHAVLNLGIAGAILKIPSDKIMIRDLLVTALFGFTLTFIALLGQIYQLHGDMAVTISLWVLLCTPFIWLFGRGVIAITPWLIAVFVSLGLIIDKYVSIEDIWQLLLSMMMLFIPLLLILISHVEFIAKQRPIFAVVIKRYGMVLLAIMAVLPPFTFWNITNDVYISKWTTIGIMCAGLAVSVMALAHDRSVQLFTGVSGIFIILPFMMLPMDSEIFSAFLFIAYFAFLAWWGAQQNNTSLIDWSIRLIILRLVIVYFEVFGFLAATGLGMILTGVIILVTLRNLNKITSWGRRLLGQA